MPQSVDVCINRFLVRELSQSDRDVWAYNYRFEKSPEPEEIYKATSRILWNIQVPGARLESRIVTSEEIAPERLNGDGWSLELIGQEELAPESYKQRLALEQLSRRWLEGELRKAPGRRLDYTSSGGFIWWNEKKAENCGRGWEVHSGVQLDIAISPEGCLCLEIDSHHRFYTPWLLHDWLEQYREVPIDYVRNTYDHNSWLFCSTSQEHPNSVLIPELNISVGEYHRERGANSEEVDASLVVYVKRANARSSDREIAHLSRRLRPSISMEILSYLAEQDQPEAKEVFRNVRKTIAQRLEQGSEVAKWIVQNIYRIDSSQPAPQELSGFRFEAEPLITRTGTVSKPQEVIKKGCLRTGESKFGCLDLSGSRAWPNLIRTQLISTAIASNFNNLYLEEPKCREEYPDTDLARRRFWSDFAARGILTVLVVSPWLSDGVKIRLRREALQSGIALQFMLPMSRPDNYRATNITLGLLVKAGWQPVGVRMPEHNQAADIAIGFDAGTNRKLFYGTSAFAVLGDGQSLGWEIPEAQVGERFSGEAIWQATLNIIERFRGETQRHPRRVLLLRDGLVRDNEFNLTIRELESEGIAVDLLEVHKSGAGRIAHLASGSGYVDAHLGVGVSIQQGKIFRLITSQAKAGGSARPLEVVKIHGDTSLALLAEQVFRLSQFHPASGFFASRLPMPLHYADKMIKEVQRLGQLGILHGVNRKKIFAA
ncbi:MAG TPA: argonaute PAZ domain-containing protein [Allocoleopsis sp.]